MLLRLARLGDCEISIKWLNEYASSHRTTNSHQSSRWTLAISSLSSSIFTAYSSTSACRSRITLNVLTGLSVIPSSTAALKALARASAFVSPVRAMIVILGSRLFFSVWRILPVAAKPSMTGWQLFQSEPIKVVGLQMAHHRHVHQDQEKVRGRLAVCIQGFPAVDSAQIALSQLLHQCYQKLEV